MRAFLHFVCVPVCFCEKFRRLEGGFATFRNRDGHRRKDVFLTFDVCTWEERAELRLVFCSHRRTSAGNALLSVCNRVACVAKQSQNTSSELKPMLGETLTPRREKRALLSKKRANDSEPKGDQSVKGSEL